MRFADIIGNTDAVRALRGMADSGRIPHAMLFHENDGCGAMALVLAFLQYLNCRDRQEGDACGHCVSCNQVSKVIYPGIRFTFPVTSGSKVSGAVKDLTCDLFAQPWRELVLDNPFFLESEFQAAMGFEKKQGLIAVAEGKAILQKLSLASATEGYRAMVIYLPERMNQQTANMLLKAIEEPADATLFLLITHAPESVLQTIASRCQPIRVLPLSREEIQEALTRRFGKSPQEAAMAATLSGGSLGKALHLLSEQEETAALRDLFQEMLTRLMNRDLLRALEAGEGVAALESRERQKAFCAYAGNALRQIFMVQQGMQAVAGIPPADEEFIVAAASRLNPVFCQKAMDALAKAAGLVDRNVLQKAIFTNLVDRLFVSI
ncbi:MAG: hypothetical protein IJ652_03405 [Bacteroidales bacterium]|nr:hypothetical protein [Bacteroidales bacterium]